MDRAELIRALDRLRIETGSLACLGCGHEHRCGTHGCAVINEAIRQLRAIPAAVPEQHREWLRRRFGEVEAGQTMDKEETQNA